MQVRSKFKVQSVTHTAEGAAVVLFPVTSGSKENEQFFKYTPAGQIQLSTVNAAAAEQFKPGSSFYVDFTLAD